MREERFFFMKNQSMNNSNLYSNNTVAYSIWLEVADLKPYTRP